MVNMNEKIQNIKNEIGKVIKGKEEVIDTVLAAMLAEGHILLEDVPGLPAHPVYAGYRTIRHYRLYDVRQGKRKLPL